MMGNGIGWAVKQMQDGKRVAREGWNGKGMWLMLHTPNPGERFMDGELQPHVVMKTAQGNYVPWLCSQTDLLATDWRRAP